jgi:hypothetical protein
VDCVNILQYVTWFGACGVVNKEHIIYISRVEMQDFGVDEVFDDGSFRML